MLTSEVLLTSVLKVVLIVNVLTTLALYVSSV